MASKVHLVWRENALNVMLNYKPGIVWRHLNKRGTMIKTAAVAQAGFRTGALKASINMVIERTVYGQMMTIGSTLNYALAHHNGTKPHIIHGRNGGMLRFTSKGRVVYSRAVLHPGTRPNRFLADNLYLIL